MPFVIQTCPNRANPYHECSIYCEKRYGMTNESKGNDADIKDYVQVNMPKTSGAEVANVTPSLSAVEMLNMLKNYQQEGQKVDARNAVSDIYLRIQSDPSVQLRQTDNRVTYRGTVSFEDWLRPILSDPEKYIITRELFAKDDVRFKVSTKCNDDLEFTCSFPSLPKQTCETQT
jgi:hypothetical protein